MKELGQEYLELLKAKDGQQFDEVNGACLDIEPLSMGKDTEGVECNTHQLHEVVLKIVLEMDRVCRKNNIDYALAFGSALGIHNYKGFIPWDDDADFVIKYEDIDRFIEACKKDLSDDFVLECWETDKRYNVLIPTMKLRYKHSYVKEFNHNHLPNKCKNGDTIFVDIVAMVDVPDDKLEHKKVLRYAKRRVVPYWFIDSVLRLQPHFLKKQLKKYERKMFEKYHGKTNSVAQTFIVPWQDYNMPLSAISCPRDVCYPFREYEFEGHKLYSFNNVPEFCKIRYGERCFRKFIDGKWVDPFPKERRNMGHIKEFNLRRYKK